MSLKCKTFHECNRSSVKSITFHLLDSPGADSLNNWFAFSSTCMCVRCSPQEKSGKRETVVFLL